MSFRHIEEKVNLLLDLNGTLHLDDSEIPGAREALAKLLSLPKVNSVRFITNSTKETRSAMFDRLSKMGFNLVEDHIHTSMQAVANFLEAKQLNPVFILADQSLAEFNMTKQANDERWRLLGDAVSNGTAIPFDSVVIGLCPSKFDYGHLDLAFQLLQSNDHCKLITMHKGRVFVSKKRNLVDDQSSVGSVPLWHLGPGVFVEALEYGLGTSDQTVVVGKPSLLFFTSLLDKLDPLPFVMVGDDVVDDLSCLKQLNALGYRGQGILVRTGKYKQDDEDRIDLPYKPDWCIDSIAKLVDLLN